MAMSGVWSGEDIGIGPGVDGDKAESAAKRKATLVAMGIKPLVAFSSEMMDPPPPKPKPKVKANPKSGWANRPTPRKDAMAAGRTHFLSDKPCPANHDSRKYTSTGQCVACVALSGEAVATARLRAKALT